MDEIEAKGELRTIFEAIERIGKSKKDSWDKLQTLSTALAVLLNPAWNAFPVPVAWIQAACRVQVNQAADRTWSDNATLVG